jgi:hypothetical protein
VLNNNRGCGGRAFVCARPEKQKQSHATAKSNDGFVGNKEKRLRVCISLASQTFPLMI